MNMANGGDPVLPELPISTAEMLNWLICYEQEQMRESGEKRLEIVTHRDLSGVAAAKRLLQYKQNVFKDNSRYRDLCNDITTTLNNTIYFKGATSVDSRMAANEAMQFVVNEMYNRVEDHWNAIIYLLCILSTFILKSAQLSKHDDAVECMVETVDTAFNKCFITDWIRAQGGGWTSLRLKRVSCEPTSSLTTQEGSRKPHRDITHVDILPVLNLESQGLVTGLTDDSATAGGIADSSTPGGIADSSTPGGIDDSSTPGGIDESDVPGTDNTLE